MKRAIDICVPGLPGAEHVGVAAGCTSTKRVQSDAALEAEGLLDPSQPW